LKRLLILGFALVIAVPTTAVAADAPAPQEQFKLRKADVTLARKVAVQKKDLGAGWIKTPADELIAETMTCEGYPPDLSRFTVTGYANTSFEHKSGTGHVDSSVAVFKTKTDAAGDFEASTGPGFLECLRAELEETFAQETEIKVSIVSASTVQAPKVGQRAYAVQIVALVQADAVSANVYLDGLFFQKGRTVSALYFTNGIESLPGQLALARRVAARMR
jgi:hypothetical protein